MKKIYKYIIPTFLKNFDTYLLQHYPVTWRTKAIFVLFYGTLAAIILFTAGLLYPVDAQHLTVSPDAPINLGYDSYYLWAMFFVSIGIFYWGYTQFQLKYPFTKATHALLTLAIYALSFWFLFSITTLAFRTGTIVKTAHFWMNDKDLNYLENSGIYPYGFVLLESDMVFNQSVPDTFFQKREDIFKSICKTEDSLFQYNYVIDSSNWIRWFKLHNLEDCLEDYLSYRSDLSDRSYLSYLSYRSDLSHRSYLSDLSDLSHRSYLSYLSHRSYLSYRSYRSDLSDRSYLSDLSDLSDLSYRSYRSYRSDLSDLSYRSYRSDLSDLSDLSYRSDRLYLSYLSAFSKYKKLKKLPILFVKFKFKNEEDSIRLYIGFEDSITILRPTLPYSVENAVRSVKNARMFLQYDVYFRHCIFISKYAFVLISLWFFVPFLKNRQLFSILLVCILGGILGMYFIKDKQTITAGRNISNIFYLFIPATASLYLLFSAFSKKQSKYFNLAVSGLFTGVLLVLTSALFTILRSKLNFNEVKIFEPPYNLAFYGVQVLGVIGAVLTTYVRSLPKK